MKKLAERRLDRKREDQGKLEYEKEIVRQLGKETRDRVFAASDHSIRELVSLSRWLLSVGFASNIAGLWALLDPASIPISDQRVAVIAFLLGAGLSFVSFSELTGAAVQNYARAERSGWKAIDKMLTSIVEGENKINENSLVKKTGTTRIYVRAILNSLPTAFFMFGVSVCVFGSPNIFI